MNSISRRSFLKFAGLVAAESTLIGTDALGKAHEHVRRNPDRLAVLVDTTLCIGQNCRRCEFACAKVNQLPEPVGVPEDPTIFEHVRRGSATQLTVVNRFAAPNVDAPIYVKRQCMHCEEPACASACPVNAFTKTHSGAVTYNADVCMGCRYCMVACPFDVPAYEYNEPLHPRIQKCSFCFESHISNGTPPACIAACPREVMTLGKRDQIIQLARQKIGRQPERYVDHIYGEHEVGGTSWMYLAAVPFEQIGFRSDLGTIPYPELTRNYLSAAPLVMTIWPAFFLSMYLFQTWREPDKAPESNGRVTEREES